MGVKLILLVAAVILFVLEALAPIARVRLGWLGMACFAAAFIF